MIESIVPVFKLLCFDFGKYACIIALSLFLSNVLAFLVEFTLTLSSKKERNGVYFLCFSLVGIIISAYFSVQDYLGVKRLFISANYVYAFLTLYSVCALILSKHSRTVNRSFWTFLSTIGALFWSIRKRSLLKASTRFCIFIFFKTMR